MSQRHAHRMGEVIVGSDAITAGTVSRGQLRWNYRAIYPDIYVPKAVEPTLAHRAEGAWRWSSGAAVAHPRWGNDQPDNHQGEHCGEWRLKTGDWNDLPCDRPVAGLCEIATPSVL